MFYKGYTIAKYRNARNGIRWCVENDKGVELIFDQTKKGLCLLYVDSILISRYETTEVMG